MEKILKIKSKEDLEFIRARCMNIGLINTDLEDFINYPHIYLISKTTDCYIFKFGDRTRTFDKKRFIEILPIKCENCSNKKICEI